MIRLLRRTKAVALALLLMSPGMGGMAVQALHPCPAHTPMADAGMHHPAGHHHDGAPGSEAPTCHCISSCATTASPSSPTDGRILAAVAAVVVSEAPRSVLQAPWQLPLDLLPPSTAPPLTTLQLA